MFAKHFASNSSLNLPANMPHPSSHENLEIFFESNIYPKLFNVLMKYIFPDDRKLLPKKRSRSLATNLSSKLNPLCAL